MIGILKNVIEEVRNYRKYEHKREPFFNIAYEYLKNCKNILDLGPGNGEFIEFLKKMGFKNKICGYEGNEETVKLLKKKGINCKYGRLPKINFSNVFFDGIHASHILEHLYPEELYETMFEIKRVLKKDGILVISTPLLWEEFYSDLSHIKPYNPDVFIKYLCEDIKSSHPSRKKIGEFKLLKIFYRYRFEGYNPVIFKHIPFFNIFSILFFKFLRKIGIGYYRKTGYTIIFQKVD